MKSDTLSLPLEIASVTIEYIPADTSALICLTRASEHAKAYEAFRNNRWVISSALEHSLPMMSHDGHQVELAREMHLKVYTNPGYALDSRESVYSVSVQCEIT